MHAALLPVLASVAALACSLSQTGSMEMVEAIDPALHARRPSSTDQTNETGTDSAPEAQPPSPMHAALLPVLASAAALACALACSLSQTGSMEMVEAIQPALHAHRPSSTDQTNETGTDSALEAQPPSSMHAALLPVLASAAALACSLSQTGSMEMVEAI